MTENRKTSWDDLIDLDPHPRRVWQAHELSAILAHQLSVPLVVELGQHSLTAIQQVAGQRDVEAHRMTLGQLLLMPEVDPEADLLRLVKEFAKTHLGDPLSPLPTEVASIVYFAAIAAGIVRCRKQITSLDEKAVRDGLEWAAAQKWIDRPLQELFQAAMRRIGVKG